MHIIFLSSLFPKRLLSVIQKNSKGNIDNAANTLQWNLLKGFAKHFNTIEVVNAPHIGSFPLLYKKLFIRNDCFVIDNNIKGTSVRYCNFAILKNKFICSALTNKMKSSLKANPDKDTLVIVYGMLTSYVKAAINLKRKNPKIKICLIIPDLPKYMGNSVGLIWTLRRFIKESPYKYINEIDCFVLLADAMAESLGIQDKPWIRVEGMIDPFDANNTLYQKKSSKKMVLYTGTLATRYGILDLIDAFQGIDNPDYELYICGGGNTEKFIKQKANSDKRIRFMGLVSRQEALELQKSATVLINPRSSQGEYTKYSFPSKTMEYLLSGKPVIMRKLPGIPEEYHKHLFFTKDDSVEALRKSIVDVCEMNSELRAQLGYNAREFLLKEKNYVVQTEKIVRLINTLSKQ
jgi:glycosyltransferase involved in cell wall biosynthesis